MKIILILFVLLSLGACQEKKPQTTIPKLEEIEPEILPSKDTLSIVAVGDIMIGSAFPSEEFLPKDDGLNSFDAVKEYLKGDIVFGNLEGVFLDYGNSEKCKGKEPHRCYAFRMPERYAQIIKEAGFNVMSVANNHSMDFGEKGKKRTVEILEELNIHFAGYQEKPFEIFEKEGIKYAFCAFAPNLGMQSLLRISEAENIVRQLKNEVDIVIVSFHGGAEGTKHTRVPKKEEFFYGENRGDVYLFAHKMIDSGADIVLGHGPHITRAVEVYQGKFIAYSLGNFNTYGRFNLDKENGIAPLLDIQLDQNGNFIKAKVVSIKQIRNKGMFIDDEEKAFAELKRLSDLDFPNHSLIFENGEIRKRRKL